MADHGSQCLTLFLADLTHVKFEALVHGATILAHVVVHGTLAAATQYAARLHLRHAQSVFGFLHVRLSKYARLSTDVSRTVSKFLTQYAELSLSHALKLSTTALLVWFASHALELLTTQLLALYVSHAQRLLTTQQPALFASHALKLSTTAQLEWSAKLKLARSQFATLAWLAKLAHVRCLSQLVFL